MNREYIYLNGKCVVENEDGERRVEDYTDKTDEILVTENVIETLEEDLSETRREIKRRKGLIKSDRNCTIFSAICFSLIPVAIQFLMILLLGPDASELLFQENVIAGQVIKYFTLGVTGIFGGLFTYSSFSSYRKNKKRVSGLISEKKALEETLDREREHLLDLQIEKNKTVAESEFFEKEVDDLETLRGIRSYINLYYDCGYNKEKYGKYLQDGKLSKKLGKYYNEHGIELIEEYLEEQGYSRRLTK